MRAVLFSLSLVSALALAPFLAHAQCPKDVSKASYDLWAANTLRNPVVGTHACGRRMSCTPGQVGMKPTRKCRWL